jgi:hypothetical protein
MSISKRQRRKAKRAKDLSKGKLRPFYVLAWGMVQVYGGPEEGGWYATLSRHIEVRKCYTWRDGLKAARKLRRKHPTCRYGRYSVLGGEDIYIQTYYDPSGFPREVSTIPRWE